MSNTKPVLGSQINYGHPLSVGLVGCWLMNEGAGSFVNDLSGNKLTGKLITAGATWTIGETGNAVNLDGTSGAEVDCGTPSQLDFDHTTSFTIAAKLRASNPSAILGWFCKGDNVKRLMGFSASSTLQFEIDDNASPKNIVIGSLDTNYHVVNVVYDAPNNKLIAYKDGTFKNETNTAGLGDFSNAAASFEIGGWRTTGSEWEGDFEYFYVYNRVLFTSEIANLYTDPFCMFRRDPIELWTAAAASTVTPASGPKTHIMGKNKCSYATKRCVARNYVNV